MPTKQEAHTKISAAEVASGEALEKWRAAYIALGDDVLVNGFGVLRDRVELKSRLLDSRARIDEALKALDSVCWPTDADYDHF